MRKTGFLLTIIAVGAALGLAASEAAETKIHGKAAPSKRLITVAAVEPKGGATVDKEAFPKSSLPEGGGFLLRQPDASGRWEVSTYVWMPSQIFVSQGDEVTLQYVGINGAEHPSLIEGYDIYFNVKRGEVSTVTFKADKAGVFRILCGTHHPSMHGELIVSPKT